MGCSLRTVNERDCTVLLHTMTSSWQFAWHHAIRWPNTKSLFLFAGLNVALEGT